MPLNQNSLAKWAGKPREHRGSEVLRSLRFLWVLLFPLMVMASSSKAGHQADELLQEAQNADPRSPGNGNFRLRAKFKILDARHSPVEGNYLLAWANEKQWREEFSATDFQQVRLRGVGGIWESREPAYPTRGIWDLMHALMFYYRLTPGSDEVLGNPYLKKNNGKVFRCIKTKRNGAEHRELCFDEHLPGLAAEIFVHAFKTYVFEEYGNVGDRSMPRHIQIFENKVLEVDFHIEELETVKQWEARSFEKPENAVWRNWCPRPDSARLTNAFLLHPRHYVNVPEKPWTLIYGRIGTDGAWHDLRVVESGGFHGRDNLSLEEMKKLEGQPATCDGVPVELEMMLYYHP